MLLMTAHPLLGNRMNRAGSQPLNMAITRKASTGSISVTDGWANWSTSRTGTCTAGEVDGGGLGTGHTFFMSCPWVVNAQMTNTSNAMMISAHTG